MSELNIPESWAEASLGQLSEKISYGGTTSASENGDYKFLRITDLTEDGVDWNSVPYCKLKGGERYLVENGDIVIARTGGTVGKSYRIIMPPENAIFASYLIKISPSDLIRESNFLSLYLKSPFYWEQIQEKAQGAAQPNVNATKLAEIPVALAPMQEQERIVQKVESCFSKIEETEQHLKKVEILLEKYRESLLAKAFRGELISQNPDDEPASALLAKIREERAQNHNKKKKEQEFSPISDDEKPFELPVGWEWIRIGEAFYLGILEEHKDGNHGSSYPRSHEFVAEGTPYISAKAIDSEEQLDKTKFEYLNPKRARELTIGHIKEGDVLFAHNATVGPVVLFNQKFDDAVIGTSLTCFRANSEYLDNKFLLNYLRSDLYQNQVRRVMKQATRNQVPILKQREFLMPLMPLESQRMIASKVQGLLEIFAKESKMIQFQNNLISKLKESILVMAFEGRLVEQIESEGTGHELLNKILELKNQEASA